MEKKFRDIAEKINIRHNWEVKIVSENIVICHIFIVVGRWIPETVEVKKICLVQHNEYLYNK